jgi:CHAT domain-containing protein
MASRLSHPFFILDGLWSLDAWQAIGLQCRVAMPRGETAVDCLQVYFPDGGATSTLVIYDNKNIWVEHPERTPPNELRADAVWDDIRREWSERTDALQWAGAELAKWALGPKGIEALQACVASARTDRRRRRVTLYLPHHLSAWPWEAMLIEDEAAISAHDLLTLVRAPVSGYEGTIQPRSKLEVELVGVQLGAESSLVDLETAQELERIRTALQSARGVLADLRADYQGDWGAFTERIKRRGPPDVLHFCGHGMAEGRGLLFRGASGAEKEVTTETLAKVLTGGSGPECRLVVLNACSTAATDGRARPFGPLASRLVGAKVACAIGLQVPLEDDAGVTFAESLYASLAAGDAIDVAVQKARAELLTSGADGVTHAFVTVTTRAKPEPLLSDEPRLSKEASREIYYDLAFGAQRQTLKTAFAAPSPAVAVVPGKSRAGHDYVLERVPYDLEARRATHWVPLPNLAWNFNGEPEIDRAAMLEGLALAMELKPQPDSDLQSEIVDWLRKATRNGVLVVMSFGHEGALAEDAECDAVMTLVKEVWTPIATAAAQGGGRTVFLLPIIYPLAAGLDASARRTVADLAVWRGAVPVQVADELAPLTVDEVTKALILLTQAPEAEAKRTARSIVLGNDNQYILERVRLRVDSPPQPRDANSAQRGAA